MGMTLDEIWKIDDVNSFIVALANHVERKCGYGDDMEVLSCPERIFFITQTCEMEVNNGGFAQFFYNSRGDLAGELENAFQKIGAAKTAKICDTALNAFGRKLPSDLDERRELLDELASDGIDNILSKCDAGFLKYEEDLNGLNYAYVLNNKADFS